jgi:3-phenylpropionate/trans-cinnamate dioxygenase ferredoxin reductase component
VPDRHADILLVGGGIASASAARTLREEGFEGSVLLVGREPDPPYHRPPATKGYLVGRESRADALIQPATWWEQAGVELLTRTSVLELDTAARIARLSTKAEVGFGQALVATGAMVRRLGAEGAELEGIHYLRALGNAEALRRDVEDVERVVCVGGSYIGSEVAASLTELGKRVTILMQEEHVLERQFGARAGRFFEGVLAAHGIEVVGGDEVERFDGAEGRVRAVVTKGGRELRADAVVCGVGAIPDVMLARKSGLELGATGGVRCDETLRTSAAGVFAAGDVCEYESVVHGRPLRIEHEEHAAAQGATAARNLLGAGAPHVEIPYFFSDLSDWVSLEYVGPALSYDAEVWRGAEADGAFSVWYLERGRVRAMLSVAGHGDLDRARALIRSGERVAERDL